MFVAPSKKGSKLKLDASTAVTNAVHFDRYSYGHCAISSLELPPWGWLRRKREQSGGGRVYGRYHLLFRCGGIGAEFDDRSDAVDLVLFNSANCNLGGTGMHRVAVDAFHCTLPSFRKCRESPFVLFNEDRSSLMAFGGYHDGKALRTISYLLCRLLFWRWR